MNRISEMFRKKGGMSHGFSETKMSSAIAEWTAMYENRCSGEGRKSLNLASVICSELARLATIEFESRIIGGTRAEYLNKQYQRAVDRVRTFTEYACAKGGVVLKPYPDNGQIALSIIQADSFYPISFSADGDIIGGMFFESFSKDGIYYTRIEEHELKNGKYTIKNSAYKSRTQGLLGGKTRLAEVEKWSELEPVCVIENMNRPLFVYMKMPAVNTVDSNSPLGAAAFARAVDLIKDANTQYSNMLWEFESGKRALFLDECAVRRDDDGKAQLPETRLYRMLSTGDDSLFEDWSPEIRHSEYIAGLDRILRSIEFNCGLAYGTLSDVQNVDKTAEEIKASKQRSYSTVCDIQREIRKALVELTEVLDIYCDIYNFAPRGKYSVFFDFNDSIICDREKEFSEKIQLLEKGILAPWELRSWYFGEDEEAAKSRIGEINEIQMCNTLA